VAWLGPWIIFQEKVEIANLIENYRRVDYPRSVNLIQLFDSIVFFEIEAKNGIRFLAKLI